jgi:TetR/AcrR family transcriptional regulator
MDTSARILNSAERIFAERGLAGASIRELAEGAELAKASLLHHFPSKRALYGAVLQAVADDVLSSISEARTLPEGLAALSSWLQRRPTAARLVLRELIDNPARASTARKWPLAPALHKLASLVPPEEGLDPEALVMFALGGIALVEVSVPTVTAIEGSDRRSVRERLRGSLPLLLGRLHD